MLGLTPAAAAYPVDHAEPSTFQSLFEQYSPFVWRTLRHLGVHEADIEDSCQEVFLVVHRRAQDFAGQSSFRTWLYGICVRVAADYRRKAYRRRELPTSDLPISIAPASQAEYCEQAESQRLLGALLDQMGAEKREVFVLFELEELSMKEVAEALHCPLQTAYSRLHAARKFIVAALARTNTRVRNDG